MNKSIKVFVTGVVLLISTCALAQGNHGGGRGGGGHGGGHMGHPGGGQMGGYGEAQGQGQGQGRQDGSHRADRSLERGIPGLNRADQAAGQNGSQGRAKARANQFNN